MNPFRTKAVTAESVARIYLLDAITAYAMGEASMSDVKEQIDAYQLAVETDLTIEEAK